MQQLQKLQFVGHAPRVYEDLMQVLKFTEWGDSNQISLKHRPGAVDQWKDGIGSLYNKETKSDIAKESEFTEYNDLLPNYTKSLLIEFSKFIGKDLGRVRFMRQEPKRGLSVHKDTSIRYHLVLSTNQNAFFGFKTGNAAIPAVCYHIPADNQFYQVDTTKEHFVYNGGWEERIHLVICPAS